MKVTITGASGFLGRALTEKLKKDGNEVVCLGHSEKSILGSENKFIVGDITDRGFTDENIKGDLVIHTAAQKVIPIAEENPSFSFKNNILGTLNVFESAIKNGVKEVILISTDKACKPETIYGKSKEVCEWLCWYFNNKQSETKFYACRYGNVAGSAMSVFEIWDKLGREGKNIQVTVPKMTRFFFTIDEAVQVVLDTLEAKLTDRPFIPKMKSITMGEASFLFSQHYKVEVEMVGNRGMEKVHEEITDGLSSENCERFTKEEFKELLKKIGCLV